MLVVADSSPLNVLIVIGYVEILPQLFRGVVIPTQVAGELSHLRTPPVVRDFIASPPQWLQVRAPSTVHPIPFIDAGEEAAISLAVEIKADILLMDDLDGRQAAVERHLSVIGTIGLLERAAQRQLLSLYEAVDRLRRTDFRVSNNLLETALKRNVRQA